MAKAAKAVYSCTECGGESPRWQGQCPHCGAWNSLVEDVEGPEEILALVRDGALDGAEEEEEVVEEVRRAQAPRGDRQDRKVQHAGGDTACQD